MLKIKPSERVDYPDLLSMSQLKGKRLMPAAGQKPSALVVRQMYGNYYLYDKNDCVPYVSTVEEKEEKRREAEQRKKLYTCPACKQYRGFKSGFESTRGPGICRNCYLAKRSDFLSHIVPLSTEFRFKEYEFLVFDVETTGLSAEFDEVLQLSILAPDGEVLFYQNFCPQYTFVYPDASNVNGLPYEKVKDCPPIYDFIPMIRDILLKTDTLMGYNVEFDMNFIKKLGINLSGYKEIDVIKCFAEYFGDYNEFKGRYCYKSLSYAAQHFGYEFDAHDSKEDCLATLCVYNRLKELNFI